MIITPIIIPVHHHSEPERCPHCRNKLETVEVCKTCRKELPQEKGPGFLSMIAFLAILAVPAMLILLWVVFPIMAFLIDHSPMAFVDPKPFLDYFKP